MLAGIIAGTLAVLFATIVSRAAYKQKGGGKGYVSPVCLVANSKNKMIHKNNCAYLRDGRFSNYISAIHENDGDLEYYFKKGFNKCTHCNP